MLHTITKRLEICIDINIELSLADHYTWIFVCVGGRRLENFLKKKISGGMLIRDTRVERYIIPE